MSEFFNRSLPKWPQLMLVGEPVTREQALNIILRTDPFMYGDGFTNHRKFQRDFYRDSGLDRGFIFEPGHPIEDLPRISRLGEALEHHLGRIELHYVISEWTASAFVLGPHGFCSPEGELFFQDNVGKWPDVQDVYEDFVRLAKAFPFLDFKATLYDGESCEWEDRPLSPVVSFVVKDGEVTLTDEDFGLHQSRRPQVFRSLMSDRGEIGMPEDMLQQVIARLREATNAILAQDAAER